MPRTESGTFGVACELRVILDRRFDLPALRGFRRTVSDAGNLSLLELDFSAICYLDAAALRLLADDLAGIEARGAHVVVRRLPGELA
ncbi:MAG: STAS domain-containing protein, partial [Gemmatimonadota bacterium]